MVREWSHFVSGGYVPSQSVHKRLVPLARDGTDPPPLAQPLAGSWQDRVKAAKRAEKRAAKKAAKAAADSGVDLESLSKGLPTGWQAMLDAASGDVYYGNLSTKVGAWVCWCITNIEDKALRHAAVQWVTSCREVDHLGPTLTMLAITLWICVLC